MKQDRPYESSQLGFQGFTIGFCPSRDLTYGPGSYHCFTPCFVSLLQACLGLARQVSKTNLSWRDLNYCDVRTPPHPCGQKRAAQRTTTWSQQHWLKGGWLYPPRCWHPPPVTPLFLNPNTKPVQIQFLAQFPLWNIHINCSILKSLPWKLHCVSLGPPQDHLHTPDNVTNRLKATTGVLRSQSLCWWRVSLTLQRSCQASNHVCSPALFV